MRTKDLAFRCPGCNALHLNPRDHPDPRAVAASEVELRPGMMLALDCRGCGNRTVVTL